MAGHVPHLLVERPWDTSSLDLDDATIHHLRRVLRRSDGARVSYTDGAGVRGYGELRAGHVLRGEEHRVPRDRRVALAVAAPRSSGRARFVVEKAAELGVAQLMWLPARRVEGRPPPPSKTVGWARSALEQARGAWRMEIGVVAGWDELPPPVVVADPEGRRWSHVAVGLDDAVTIAIGPEGGFDPEEIPIGLPRVALSHHVLRVETAAVVAAALAMLPTGDHPAPG